MHEKLKTVRSVPLSSGAVAYSCNYILPNTNFLIIPILETIVINHSDMTQVISFTAVCNPPIASVTHRKGVEK